MKDQQTEYTTENAASCGSAQSMYPPEDEIDLVDLIRLLLARKWLIVCLTIAGLVLASLYAFSRPVVYQSEARIAQNISVDIGGSALNQKAVYGLFFDNVNSPTLQAEVLTSVQLVGHHFTVNEKKGTINFKGGDPAKLAEPINLLLRTAEQKTLFGIRQQRLTLLEDALVIAERAGIVDPILTDSDAPLYFYGSRVLTAEIVSLQKDNHIESGSAGEVAPGDSQFRTVILSQSATVPVRPVGPKAGLIMVMGAVLGFMVAIVVVFGLNFKDKILSNE